jgi:hypothetical protein
MDANTLCGSSLFTGTMRRIQCPALADRIELNTLRLDELYRRVRGREMRPDEDRLWTALEDAIEADKRTLSDAVLMLTGISAERIGKVL